MNRRTFLRHSARGAAGVAAAAALPELLLADPYAPLPAPAGARRAAPVRVRGRVHDGARGLGGVRVTDGRTVVRTGADGGYELVSDAGRPFVYLSVPAGYQIPVGPAGTARLHRPLRPNAAGDAEAAFALARLAAPDDRHRLLLLADPQTQNLREVRQFQRETVPDVRALVAAAPGVPTFGIGCGDLMFDDLALYPEYERAVRDMGVPFFQAVGNHDLDQAARTSEASTATFAGRFGPEYYSFDRGAVRYVVLNDVFWHGAGYLGYLPAEQLAWLKADLADLEPGRPVVVALHIPALSRLYSRERAKAPPVADAVQNREALYRLLAPYKAHLLSGHTHASEHVFEGGVHEHVHGTVCGAWWSGPICHDGTPNGYGVYDVRGEEVRWTYKATGHPPDHQLRVYPPGADPAAPGQIVANVWNWDPEWRVVWYEDGERKGAMTRRTGLDPLSVSLHSGADRPPLRPWVDPQPTDHLFYAPASPRAREVRVEAADRWGRRYSAVLGAPGPA